MTRRHYVELLIALMLVVAAGYLRHRVLAGGGYPAQVLALKENAVLVSNPRGSVEIVVELAPGDRVLRTSGGILNYDRGVYIPVYTATGDFGWLRDGEAITETISPVYTTSSRMAVGLALVVAEEAICRSDPSFRAETVQTLAPEDQLTITGGPYPAELGLWWMVASTARDAACWVYDTPGVFALAE